MLTPGGACQYTHSIEKRSLRLRPDPENASAATLTRRALVDFALHKKPLRSVVKLGSEFIGTNCVAVI